MRFLSKIERNFHICYLTCGNSIQNEASRPETGQNCVTLIRIFKAENQDSWKFDMIFLITPANSNSFFIDPWNFDILFVQYL